MIAIKLEDFDLDITIIDEKWHKNILVYEILYKTLIDPKLLHIRFDEIDGFIWIYDRNRHLKLFGWERYETIYNRIRYLMILKRSITYIFSHYFAKNDSYDSLPIEKILTLHNVIIHIKSVLNKDKKYYYYKIFLENALIN